MGTRLALLANHVHLDLVGKALLLFALRLLHDTVGDEHLLNGTPGGGRVVVEQDADRDVPTEEDHHHAHDDAHEQVGAPLLGRGVAGVQVEREEREQTEHEVEQHVDDGPEVAELGDRTADGAGQGVEDAVEVRVGREVVLQDAEEAEEDGHLQDQREAAAERVELVLPLELHQLLVHALRVVRIALLDLLDPRLQGLHARRGPQRVDGEGGEDETDDERQDDDGKAPVAHDRLDDSENLRQQSDKPFPHASSALLCPSYGTGS